MKAVLVLDNSVYVTGAIKAISAAARQLSDRYCFEFAMDARGAAARHVSQLGFVVHDVRFREISRSPAVLLYPFALLANAWRIRRLVRRARYSIVHVNDIYNLVGLLATAGPRGVRIVQHVRLLRSSYLRPLYGLLARIVCANADAVVAVSQAVVADLGACGKVHRIPDALADGAQHPAKEYRTDASGWRFLLVGNYVDGKGHDLAVRAFASIATRLPHATLHFTGHGSNGELDAAYVRALHDLCASSGLVERVSFGGYEADIEATMKAADVVLNFSKSESFSMVCLEAQRYGVALIATDSGGPRELIEQGVTGLLVPTGDVAAAAEAMYRLASAPTLAAQLGRAAARKAAADRTIEDASRRLAEVYERVLAP